MGLFFPHSDILNWFNEKSRSVTHNFYCFINDYLWSCTFSSILFPLFMMWVTCLTLLFLCEHKNPIIWSWSEDREKPRIIVVRERALARTYIVTCVSQTFHSCVENSTPWVNVNFGGGCRKTLPDNCRGNITATPEWLILNRAILGHMATLTRNGGCYKPRICQMCKVLQFTKGYSYYTKK